MLKAGLQNLVRAIPLRPKVALAFVIFLALAGPYLPWEYLFVSIRDSSGLTEHVIVPRLDLFRVFDPSCISLLSFGNGVKLLPSWAAEGFWVFIYRFSPFLVGQLCVIKFDWKGSIRGPLVMYLLFMVIFAGISVYLSAENITCGSDWILIVYDSSVSWFSIWLPVITLLLGIYAYNKQTLINGDIQSP